MQQARALTQMTRFVYQGSVKQLRLPSRIALESTLGKSTLDCEAEPCSQFAILNASLCYTRVDRVLI
jgi:hypothetical protein